MILIRLPILDRGVKGKDQAKTAKLCPMIQEYSKYPKIKGYKGFGGVGGGEVYCFGASSSATCDVSKISDFDDSS